MSALCQNRSHAPQQECLIQPRRQRLWVYLGERELATLRLRVVMYLVGVCSGRGRSHIISASSSTAAIPMIKSANAAKS